MSGAGVSYTNTIAAWAVFSGAMSSNAYSLNQFLWITNGWADASSVKFAAPNQENGAK